MKICNEKLPLHELNTVIQKNWKCKSFGKISILGSLLQEKNKKRLNTIKRIVDKYLLLSPAKRRPSETRKIRQVLIVKCIKYLGRVERSIDITTMT